jgi:hypothetical protein
LRTAVKTYAHIRLANPVLRTGEFVPVYAEGRRLVILRHLEGERVLVAFNADGGEWELDVPVGEHFGEGVVFEDLLGGEGGVVENGSLIKSKLGPWEGKILKPKD